MKNTETSGMRSEYDELRSAGLTKDLIKMLRNTGATHRAILLWAKQHGKGAK